MRKTIYILIVVLLSVSFVKFPDKEQITIPLSNPKARGVLIVENIKGSINVQGYNGVIVIIEARNRYEKKENTEKLNAEGLEKIPVNNLQVTAEEENNTVVIRTNSKSRTIDLDIKIPFNFDLKLKTVDNGNINVTRINGNMELSNVDGDIELTDVSGFAIANTIDGDIIISFNKVAENTPMAFSTVDGKIDVKFPEDFSAMLKMKSDYGDVFSDFDIELQERKKKVEKNTEKGYYRVTIEEWTYGKINNGGPEIMLKTLDGNIYIRKRN